MRERNVFKQWRHIVFLCILSNISYHKLKKKPLWNWRILECFLLFISMCYPSQRWQLPHRLWDFILGASTSVILHKTQEASGTQIENSSQQGKMAGCYYWPTLCKMGLVSIFLLFSPRLAMDMSEGCCQNECWGVLASHAMQTGVLAGPAACFANTGSNTATLIALALWQRRLTAQTKSSLPP